MVAGLEAGADGLVRLLQAGEPVAQFGQGMFGPGDHVPLVGHLLALDQELRYAQAEGGVFGLDLLHPAFHPGNEFVQA